jgi:hypothetical protein
MFNSSVLDIAVGLSFVFLSLSLAVSALTEALASATRLRSAMLLEGVKKLLNDQQFAGLARDLYNHALINPLDNGRAISERDLARRLLPAYIHPAQFADALIDVTKIMRGTPQAINSQIAAIADPQIRSLLTGIFAKSGADVQRVRNELAIWFDNAMDRVGGAYKRRTQLVALISALALAGGMNVSAIDIGEALWHQPMVVRTIAPKPGETATQALGELEALGSTTAGIPIGWTTANARRFCTLRGIWTALGWIITAIATLFGAPFWYDTLQQIIRLKGSGPSPDEKRSRAGAAA